MSLLEHMEEIGAQPTLPDKIHREETVNTIRSFVSAALPEVVSLLTGSTFLSMEMSSSDIDMLLLGPVTLQECEAIERLRIYFQREQSIVPRIIRRGPFAVFSAFINGIKVDFTYARLQITADFMALPYYPIDFVCLGADEGSRPLIAAYEFNCEVLRLTKPEYDKFRLVVRVVKLWARAHDIVGNIRSVPMIAWLIMIGKVFVLYSKHSFLVIMNRFFKFYKLFDWRHRTVIWLSKKIPLCEFRTDSRPMEVQLPFPPFSNLTGNVPIEKFEIIKRAFASGLRFIEARQRGEDVKWPDLFVPSYMAGASF
ncbi:hypothetical protein ACOME3_008002 [Neoechinorhynchus agilis]